MPEVSKDLSTSNSMIFEHKTCHDYEQDYCSPEYGSYHGRFRLAEHFGESEFESPLVVMIDDEEVERGVEIYFVEDPCHDEADNCAADNVANEVDAQVDARVAVECRP